MQVVGARFQIDVDHRARRAAVLGVEAVRLHAHLADRLDRGPTAYDVWLRKSMVLTLLSTPFSRKLFWPLPRTPPAEGRRSRNPRAGLRRQHAGRKPREVSEVSLAAQRNVRHRLRVHRRADVRALRLQQRCRRAYFDGLVYVADRQDKVDARPLAGFEEDVLLLCATEAWSADADVIRGRLQRGTKEFPPALVRDVVHLTGADLGDGYLGIGNDAAGRIGDGSDGVADRVAQELRTHKIQRGN